MSYAHELYVTFLKDRVMEGVDSLESVARARVLEGKGPYLTEDETSLADVYQFVHSCSGSDEKKVFIQTFLNLLSPFRDAWFNNEPVSDDNAALLGFSLTFFEQIEEDAPFRHALKTLADAVVESREKFFRLVGTSHASSLYGQLERIFLKYHPENNPSILLNLWDAKDREGDEELARLARLLDAYANLGPEVLETRHLFEFFKQTENLDPKERVQWLRPVFSRIGIEVANRPEGRLTKNARDFLYKAMHQITQQERILFLNYFMLAWPLDARERFNQMREELINYFENHERIPRVKKSNNFSDYKKAA
ncbi:MAG: hypothetical protein HQL93_08205 [Magnetococcales bacterium]|nr:hypothetical protein [Magnetococcales bacterium]